MFYLRRYSLVCDILYYNMPLPGRNGSISLFGFLVLCALLFHILMYQRQGKHKLFVLLIIVRAYAYCAHGVRDVELLAHLEGEFIYAVYRERIRYLPALGRTGICYGVSCQGDRAMPNVRMLC